MVRKMLSVLGIAIISLLAMGGVSSAAPAPVAYPAPPVVINITVIIIINNDGTIIFNGGGFDFSELVSIDAVNTSAPLGLRSSSALSQMAAAQILVVPADSAGNFSVDVTKYLNADGVWKLTATGLTSGKTKSDSVTIASGGPQGTGSETWTGAGSSSSSGALASTGASVAGPIAIGAAALFAGLAMLFFGTRGVIRRKGSKSGGAA